MDLRQLRYVIAVAEELSFTRAAARLHIAQPALTKQIRRVEDDLQVALFHRTTRAVQVTEAGAVFLERAKRLLGDLDELTRASQRASRGEVGRLVIGFIGTVAFHFFPRLLRDYRAAFPGVEVELVELQNRPLIDALRNERVDVAFMRPFFEDEDIASRQVLDERLLVAVPSGHRFAKRKALSIRELKNEPFVTANRRPAPSIYAFLMSICERAGFHPRVVQAATDIQTVVGLVAAGMGVAIVTESIKRLGVEGVRYCEFTDVKDKARIVVAWRKADRSAVLDNFLGSVMASSHQDWKR
ncbi:MAG: LysR family transcriptional regulator [Burkholderiales bacterium]